MQGGSQAQRGLLRQGIEDARAGEEVSTRAIIQVGNSAGLTIPDGLLKWHLGLECGDEVEVIKCDGGVYIQPSEDGDGE